MKRNKYVRFVAIGMAIDSAYPMRDRRLIMYLCMKTEMLLKSRFLEEYKGALRENYPNFRLRFTYEIAGQSKTSIPEL